MNNYKFLARLPTKEKFKGVMKCESKDELISILKKHNYDLIRCRILRKRFQLELHDKATRKEIISICQKLYMVLKSGISFADGIDYVSKSFFNKTLSTNLSDIAKELKKGRDISNIFDDYPKYFPEYFKSMIIIGEHTGNMKEVIKDLIDYYQTEENFNKKLTSALFYPIILSVFAVGVVVLLNLFIIPNFKDMLLGMNAELPFLTRLVFNVSDFFQNYILYIIGGMLVIIVGIFLLLKTRKGKYFKEYFKLKIGFFKKINCYNLVSKFSKMFNLLINSGFPIVNAINMINEILNNPYLVPRLRFASDEIKRGVKLSEALNTMNVFPNLYLETINISSDSGNLSYSLKSLSKIYDDQNIDILSRLSSIIEPFFIVFIAVVICLIVAAIYVPLFTLFDNLLLY